MAPLIYGHCEEKYINIWQKSSPIFWLHFPFRKNQGLQPVSFGFYILNTSNRRPTFVKTSWEPIVPYKKALGHIKSMDTWLTQGQDPWPVFSVPTRMCAVCLDQLRIMGWTKVVLTPNNLSHQFKSSKGHLHVLDRNKGRKLSLESNNFKPSIWMISAKSQGTQHKIEKKVVRILLTARKAKTVP